MFTHKSLLEACSNLGLDSSKYEENFTSKSFPYGAFPDPIDLRTISFPSNDLIELEEIGKIIFNLHSQSSFPRAYALPAQEKKWARDRAIDKLLPIAIEAQKFWLDKGLQSCGSKILGRNFTLHNGKVYEIDPASQEEIDEFLKSSMKIYR